MDLLLLLQTFTRTCRVCFEPTHYVNIANSVRQEIMIVNLLIPDLPPFLLSFVSFSPSFSFYLTSVLLISIISPHMP